MPIKVGATGEEGSVIGGYNCIRDNLYRYYDARDRKSATGSDTTWNDISGNNENFTLAHGSATNHVNWYWDLNGSNQYFTMDDIPFDEDTDFSIELWAYFRNDSLDSPGGAVIMQGNKDHSFGFDRGQTSDCVRFGIRFASGTVFGVTSDPLSTDTWYHLAGTMKNDDEVILYVNGVSHGSEEVEESTFNNSGNTNMRIGPTKVLGDTSGTIYWDGAVSVVRIYNKTLSHDEVLYNFNADRGGFGV